MIWCKKLNDIKKFKNWNKFKILIFYLKILIIINFFETCKIQFFNIIILKKILVLQFLILYKL
jgi:hypothetical protein